MSSIIAKNIQDIYVNTITPLISTSANISATNITTTNLVVTSATIPNIILTGSLNANSNSNTLGNIFTTSGNVGIGTVTPTFKLDISGSTRVNSGGSVFLGNPNINLNPSYDNIGLFIDSNINSLGYRLGLIKKNGSVPSFAVSNNNNFVFQVANTTDASLVSTNTYSTIMTLSTLGNLTITGTSNSVSLSSGNIFSINSSLGTINSTGLTSGNINFTGNLFQNGISYPSSQWTTTAGNLSYTSGNVVVTNLSVSNSITATSISSSGLFSTNVTSTNIVATTISTANIASTSISSAALFSTNITSTNIVGTAISASNISSTSISSSSLLSTNVTSTNIVGTAISASNISSTSISSSGLFSTNITSTNIFGTAISASNISSTSISSSGLFSTNITSTNIVGTAISSANISSTSISSAGLFSLNQTTTNAVHTTLTSANLFTTTTGSVLSDGLNIRFGGSILTISNSKGSYAFGSDPTDTNRQLYLVSSIPGTSNILTFRNNTTNIIYDFVNEGTGRNRFVIQQSNTASTVNPYFIIDPTNPSISLMSNTGINTTSPAFTLDVNGSGRFNNTLLATFNSNTIGNIFTTGGNVGIGIVSPSTNLHVNTNVFIDSTNNTGLLKISSINNTNYIESGLQNITNSTSDLRFTNMNAATTFMIIASTGNVGINTATPAFTLDVNGSARINGNTSSFSNGILNIVNNNTLPFASITSFASNMSTGGSSNIIILGKDSSLNNSVLLGFTYNAQNGSNNNFNISMAGASNFFTYNTSSGIGLLSNVGINTTTPAFTLDVAGSLRAVALNPSQFSPPHTLINTGASQPSVVSLLAPNVSSGNYVTTMFGQSLSNGNCGQLSFGYNGSNNTGNNMSLSMYGGGAASFISLNNNGNMGINTLTPGYPLHVVGSSIGFVTGGYYFYANSGTALIQWSTSNQAIGIFATSAILTQNNFLASSDLRIKNICDEKINLNLIDRINPVIYTYKDRIKNPKKNIGFIAQNVIEHCPEAVTLHKGIIPDIMKLVDIIENKDTIITIKNEWHLKEKDIIKIIIDDKDTNGELITIIYSDKDVIKFKHLKLKHNVFIYGRQVHDFHELNYDYVFALGFAGIQKSRKEIKELIKDNILLKQDIKKLTEFIKSKFSNEF